ncbi:Beta-glucanase, GH16 family [Deinococcus reticulitermitis]|uniref:Beta-glucanase, GH16 family n=1 Tax=Deinococcus reticulitermitis TaxID=856736 RepID=A0A1H6Y1R2_9DEIO|nr:carbohydrate binding domain-containing protein [Deinococcus reticulitermitis]SEJ33834.1 Beta-glucanase, GH16 family [Deinococcus reticulitermitis]
MRALRPFLAPLTLALLASCGPNAAPEAEPVWQDEFDGSTLDASKWTPQIGNGILSGSEYVAGWGNNELEYYTGRPGNVRVENGELVITARKENYAGTANGQPANFDWTSARLRTAGKFSRTYGRFEIRAKFPTGKGLWPAIWLLPEEPNPYGTWAASGEIDIAEGWGSKPTEVAHTIHYGGVWPNNVYSGTTATYPNGGRMDGWHVYALEWTPGKLQWFVDGQLTLTKTAWWSAKGNPPTGDADLYPWPAPFDQPFHLLLNLAVGGNFDGNPDASTPDRAEMRVDYVRVYSHPDEGKSPGARPDMKYPWTPAVARPALEDGNLVYNGTFDWADTDPRVGADASRLDGVTNSAFWTLFKSDGAATLSNDGGALKVDITNAGGVNYAVQVRQDGLNIESGKRYEVSFDVWAAAPRAMMVKVGGGQDRGYAAYSGEQTVQIGSARERRTLTFDMKGVTDAAARLEFNLGNAGTGPVWIDNVVVKAVGEAASARPPAPDGNLLYNAAFTQDSAQHPGIPGVAGTAYWSIWDSGPNGLSAAVQGGEITLNVARVDPANNWHVQLNQTEVPLVAGQKYRLTFRGQASDARTVGVVIGEQGGSYARYLDATAALTSAAQTFSYEFTSPVTNLAAQLQILGAVGTPGDAYTLSFRDFRLEPIN